MTRITVLPVSGGAFPAQIGLLSELCSIGITPDVILGSSGGNVAGYVGLAGDWSPYGIRRVTKNLCSELFYQSWWPRTLSWMPSWTIGYFQGSIYQAGSGIESLFSSMFNLHNVQQVELWTGTRNRTTGKGHLFCNRPSSQLPVQLFEPQLINCMPLTFLDGQLDKIAKISVASASIPILVPHQEMDGQCYVDGGTAFASPLTPFQDVLRAVPNLHLDYVNSFDALSNNKVRRFLNLYQNGETTAHEMVESLILHDRLNAIEIVRNGTSNALHYLEGVGSNANLQQIEQIRSTSSRSILELYPTIDISVNLTHFTGQDIEKLLEQTQSNYRYRLWYRDPDQPRTQCSPNWYRC